MEFDDFPYIYIGNVIIRTVTHSIIFQRGRSTTDQFWLVKIKSTLNSHSIPLVDGLSHEMSHLVIALEHYLVGGWWA